MQEGPAPAPQPPPGRVPRVARLMALALRFDRLLREGVAADFAELARLGHVSRARVSQVMNLLNLAPDIQESFGVSEGTVVFIATALNWKFGKGLDVE